jgi:hypothetical protein
MLRSAKVHSCLSTEDLAHMVDVSVYSKYGEDLLTLRGLWPIRCETRLICLV